MTASMASPLALLERPGALRTKKGEPLSARTRHCYSIDVRQIVSLLGSQQTVDPEAEQAALLARAEWAVKPAQRRGSAPRHPGTVVDRFFNLDTPTVNALIDQLTPQCKPSTVRRKISALRAVWRCMRDDGLVEGDPFETAKEIDQSVSRVQLVDATCYSELVTLAPESVLSRVTSSSSSYVSRSDKTRALVLRDFAVLLLCGLEGLKTQEIFDLTVGALRASGADAKLHVATRFGRKQTARLVTLHPATIRAIQAYQASLVSNSAGAPSSTALARSSQTQRLFINKRGEDLSTRSVRRKLASLLTRLGLAPASPSRLRHTCIVERLAAGEDVGALRVRLGVSASFNLQTYELMVDEWKAARRAAEEGAKSGNGSVGVAPTAATTAEGRTRVTATRVQPANCG